jgi:hypothetical protein
MTAAIALDEPLSVACLVLDGDGHELAPRCAGIEDALSLVRTITGSVAVAVAGVGADGETRVLAVCARATPVQASRAVARWHRRELRAVSDVESPRAAVPIVKAVESPAAAPCTLRRRQAEDLVRHALADGRPHVAGPLVAQLDVLGLPRATRQGLLARLGVVADGPTWRAPAAWPAPKRPGPPRKTTK